MDRETPVAVEVAVPRPLPGTLTYLLPGRMAAGRLEGCRVQVPLGPSSLVGWIWSASSGTVPEGVREVSARLDPVCVLPRPLFLLVRWAAGYYAAPPGLTMAASLPPGAAARLDSTVRLADGVASGRAGGFLEPGSTVRATSLLEHFADRSEMCSRLAELESAGLVVMGAEIPSRPARAGAVLVGSPLPPGELVSAAGRLSRRAPAQAAILMQLAASPGPVPRKLLLARADASARSLDALVASGAVCVEEETVPPLSGRIAGLAGDPVRRLEQGQIEAVEEIGRAGPGVAVLLRGATGSGKTEVYMGAISGVIESGRQALVLVPEISLTPQLIARFERRFPGRIAVLHSAMRDSERLAAWSALSTGGASVAIGARSAVFAPLRRPGLIVVDEEHDSGYKQQEAPRYNARDMAVVRAALEGVPVVLGSATPSLESWGNSLKGRYRLVSLPSRVAGRPFPVVRTVPWSRREGGNDLPPELVEALARRLDAGEQAIVLVNRRGFAPSRICTACGGREVCPECGITPTYHSRGSVLRCHHCGWWRAAPARCPACGGGRFSTEGPGVQKIESLLRREIPSLRIMRMDADTVSSPGARWDMLEAFASHGADVLLGTQMVAKGHDFPRVTLVGILAADMALAFPDFRAAERAFQLVAQAAGRAGRGVSPGEVIVQTADPEAFSAALRQDYDAFLASEMPVRETLGYPPHGRIIRFLWTSRDEGEARRAAERDCSGAFPGSVRITGPSAAILRRLAGRWRFSALARSASGRDLREAARIVRESFQRFPARGVRFDVDVDPLDLL